MAMPSRADEPLASGTAFAVTDDGWLLTNAHVVKKCTRVEVKGVGISEVPKLDEINDLAALRVVPKTPIKALDFRKKPIRLGEDIVALGFPLNGLLSESIKVTTGNVNALAGIANDTRYIQISTPIQPGNSGGPIVDKDGLLLGITTATLAKEVADKIDITAQNVNFAIRSSVAELFLQSQGISYQSHETSVQTPQLSTADLAEKISPSVFPVICYGSPTEVVEVAKPEANTSLPTPEIVKPSLIDANGYDAVGFDYQTIKNVPYYSCKSACANDGQCMAFTYNTHYSMCFLKNDVMAMVRNGDAASAYSSAKSSQVIFSTFTIYRDMDFPGGDYLKLSRATYQTCLFTCVKDNSCRAFAYVRRKNECWLKSQLGTARSVPGVEFGMK
ncbi:trypsin-like peptidase domain-containing protein [Rhizobium sp. TH2]|nr:trypsin-like peptidase domain-containing protein [Rhizobium sp. TH2]